MLLQRQLGSLTMYPEYKRRSTAAASRGENGVSPSLLTVAIRKKLGAMRNAPPRGTAFRRTVKGRVAVLTKTDEDAIFNHCPRLATKSLC